MSLSGDEIQSLANAVSMWRMQENIYISFYAFYIYYLLTTMDEDVATIFPQKWNHGKVLFLVIRYGTCIFAALQLLRDFRSYFAISLMGCKGLLIAFDAAYRLSSLACDVSLGLCLSALLQMGKPYLVLITVLSAVPSIIGSVFGMVSDVQYPAESVSALDKELGYPCYVPSTEQWTEFTIYGLGRDIRRYIYFATTCLLLLAAVATIIQRYKGHKGRLVQVIRRDGGIYYITLAALRFAIAISNTPAIVSTYEADSNPAVVLLDPVNTIVIPILAQRLMINLRKADYMGKRPFASTLLFAPPLPTLEDDELDGTNLESETQDPDQRA